MDRDNKATMEGLDEDNKVTKEGMDTMVSMDRTDQEASPSYSADVSRYWLDFFIQDQNNFYLLFYFQFYYKIAAALNILGALGFLNESYFSDNILTAIFVGFSSSTSL